jgi:hypothetical protein
MGIVVNLGLDAELPLMVFAEVSVLYTLDHVFSRDGRKLKATEGRVQQLVQRAIKDVRRALKLARTKVEDYLDFRVLVVDTLCREYSFVYCRGSIHNILREEVEDLIENPMPRLRPRFDRAPE